MLSVLPSLVVLGLAALAALPLVLNRFSPPEILAERRAAALALAGMINGIAHPLLAVAAEGYFPGLLSYPFIGAASIWLFL
jgi:hypothetical protein